MTTLHIVDGTEDVVIHDETDPTWSELFDEVRHAVTYKPGYRLNLKPDAELANGRWYYQVEAERVDAITGEPGVGRGGKAYLSPHQTRSELVQLVFSLFNAYEHHECREFFRFDGEQVYGPHFDVLALHEIAAAGRTEYPAMTPIVAVDIETDGLHYGRRAWEIAMIRRDDQGQRERSFFVPLDLRFSDPKALEIGGFWDRHPSGRKISGKARIPTPGPPTTCKHDAAKAVMEWTFGAQLIGAGVHFDAETLGGLLRTEGYLPSWGYALIDVKAMAAGYLSSIARHAEQSAYLETKTGDPRVAEAYTAEARARRNIVAAPWRTDDLARVLGVTPPTDSDRHTALGDALWALRIYDHITGTGT